MDEERETTRNIADAAIEFIEERQRAAGLREKRADILRDADCEGARSSACYAVERLPYPAWCSRCRASQAVHTAYKIAVARRTAALVKLKRLVLKRAD